MNVLQNFLTALAALGLTILICAYIYFKYQYKYFKKVNITYLTPKFPMGNIKPSFFITFGQDIKVLHEELRKKNVKLGGYFVFMKPVIMLVHPDIFKSIFIKDFNYFQDRGIYYNEEKEFITHNIVTMNGDKWKPLRPKLTTLFTTGNLKYMADVMAEKTKDIDRRLEEIFQTSTSFAAKDLCSRIIIEFVCSIMYGIETNSITNPKAEFPDYGLQIVRNNLYHTTKLIFANVLPFIFQKLQMNFIKTDVQKFLIKAFGEIIDHREKHSVNRKDLLNLLFNINELADDDSDKLTKKQLIAQCFIFFLGGFNTSSTAANFCLFELTQNEEIQNKLRHEIKFILSKHQNKITYEAVAEMKYLNKVVSETLRKYPSIIIINRRCVHDYNIPGTNSMIKKGNSVQISLLGLHHDPEFYPDPEKFDPERFSEEEKTKRHPHAYFPFGDGPRGCIARRFGLLQTKISLIALLKNHKYTLSPKTKLPLKFRTESVFLVTEEEIFIDVAKI